MSTHIVIDHAGRELIGVARADESWAAAARRVAATAPGEPVAMDLSGEPKRFGLTIDRSVTLRAAVVGDLPDLIRWRQQEHILKWWQDPEPTPEAVTRQYQPRIDGQSPTRLWIVEVNGRSVGFIQDYRISDYPEYALLTPDPQAIGVDYAIGEAAWLGKGIGVAMLWVWLTRLHLRFRDAEAVFAAPDHRNAASVRMLEKVGFTQGVWFNESQATGGSSTVIGCTLRVKQVLG